MVTGINYDVSIGGCPFFFAIDDNNPYMRQTNDFKRQQIDTSPEPGEQTLSQWWVRSQDSWHRGQGVLNYDPGTNRETIYRFASGVGVNPWTQGQLALSWATSVLDAQSGDNFVATHRTGGTDCWYSVVNSVSGASGTLKRTSASVSPVSYGNPLGYYCHTEPAFGGGTVLVGSVGAILSGSDSGSSLSALWTLSGGSTVITPYWVKGRIIATSGQSIWELTLAGGTISPTATFVNPMSGGAWSAVTEAPDVILAAYNAGGRGYIYALGLNASTTAGASPTLGGFAQVAELPPGEEVTSMRTYLGSFLALGTTHGVRICDIGNNGQINTGPLTIETDSPVYALSASSSFVWAAFYDATSATNIARIDLGQEIMNFQTSGYASRSLRYAYNIDQAITGATGRCNSIAPIGDGVKLNGTPIDGAVVAVTGSGVHRQLPAYKSGGTMNSGRIRFDTNENKTFAYLKLRATVPANTSIDIYVTPAYGTQTYITTVTPATDLNTDIYLGNVIGTTAYPHVNVVFKLNSNDGVSTPTIDSWAIKATPLPFVQRKIVLPLRLADFEQDRNGMKTGGLGSAYTRLQALEAQEAAQSLVTVIDYTSGEHFTGIIQTVQFVRDTPPSRNSPNFGGRLNVVVLKVA